VSAPEYDMDLQNVGENSGDLLKDSAMDQDFANKPTEVPIAPVVLTPQQKAANTRAANKIKDKK